MRSCQQQRSNEPLRTKCILPFQTIHGVDVLLFGLYEKVYIDPTCLPYFDSDYISGEIESIINDFKKQELCMQKERGHNSRMMV